MTDFKTIIAAADDQDKMDLTIAYNAKITAAKAYQERPGKATSEDRRAVDGDYDALLQKMAAKYFPEEQPAPEGERFSNRKQALNWLNAQGYKVGQDKFYKDCKAGFPNIHRDKTISRYQVLQYGQQLDMASRGSASTDGDYQLRDAEIRKAVADANKAEIQAAQLQRELDKEWIKREDSDLEVCTWTALLRDAINHRITQGLPTLIHAVGGHLDRVADGQEVIDQAVTDACNDISRSGEVDVDIDELEEV